MTAPEHLTEQLDAALANYTAGIDRAVRFVSIDEVDMLAEFYLQTRRADLAAVQHAQVMIDDQERNYLHLHTAAFDVWRWFETTRPDLIGTRAEKLRDAVMGPRPFGCVEPQPDPRDAVIARLVEALEEIAGYDTGATAGLAYTARAALAAAKAVQK